MIVMVMIMMFFKIWLGIISVSNVTKKKRT
jgi:hypothetical protein